VLAMIPPSNAGGGAAAGREFNARERERGVERAGPDDVRADPEPVGIQLRIPDPLLQGRHERRPGWSGDAPRRRGREEMLIRSGKQSLRHQEEVLGPQLERVRERDVEPNLLPGYRTVAKGRLVRFRVNPGIDAVAGRETGSERRRRERQVAVRGIAI